MFSNADSFNQDISGWETGNVEDMTRMFEETEAFNQDISGWNTESVTNMSGMFLGAKSFNEDISGWDTDNVEDMSHMFEEAKAFNQDISGWNTESVTNMSHMFLGAKAFNQDISGWDVSNVSTMAVMFAEATSFNQDLSKWDTGNVIDMRGMFYRAASFDQSLGEWNIEEVWWMDQPSDDYGGMLDYAGLSDENYGKTLIGWADQDVNENVELGARGQFYPEEAEDDRQTLIDDYNWTIIDEGEALEDGFVTVWQTDNEGGSEDNEVMLPASGENYFVEWQEVEQVNEEWQEVSGGHSGFEEASDHHTIEFSEPGTYRVELIGLIDRFHLGYHSDPAESDALKLLEVEKWGEIRWSTMNQMFGRQEGNAYGAENMVISAEDAPDLTEVTDMSEMFAKAKSVEDGFSSWDTENVVTFGFMFYNASSFDGNVSDWDTGSAQTLSGMFYDTASFNQDISDWDTENVRFMEGMFYQAKSFDQELGSLDISSVMELHWDDRGLLDGTALSPENYGNTLIGWADQDVEENLVLGADGLQFPIDAEDARETLMNDFNWEVNDDGLYEDLGDGFVTVWQTDSTGVSEDDQVTIPAEGDNYDIEWTEVVEFEGGWREAESPLTGSETGGEEHTIDFGEPGTYRVKITGDFDHIVLGTIFEEEEERAKLSEVAAANGSDIEDEELAGIIDDKEQEENNTVQSDSLKLIEIEQWGDIEWTSMEAAFSGARYMQITAQDAPDLTHVTSVSLMFNAARQMDADISHWDTGNIEDMSGMFRMTFAFNQDISEWDTGNVTDMSEMFLGASSFSQDIGDWNTENVVNMARMFSGGTSGFNGDIGGWETGNVEDMSYMFAQHNSFNQDIGDWDTGNVEDMSYMFWTADAFNQDIGDWNTGNVENMSNMFWLNDSFNQDIGDWDTQNVEQFESMFGGAVSFNQDISGWNTENAYNMASMFSGAESFDQSLGDWDIEGVWRSMGNTLDDTALSYENYDNTLKGWAEQDLQTENTLGAEGLYYCEAGDQRQFIIDEFEWEINDEGQVENCIEGLVASETMNISADDEDSPVAFDGTGIKMTFTGIDESGDVRVDRYDQKPEDLSGVGEELTVSDQRFVITSDEDLQSNEAELRFDADELDVEDPHEAVLYTRSDEGEGEFEIIDPTEYDQDENEIYASVESFSEFVIAKGYDVSSEDKDEIPAEFTLNQNYPNPFNPTTTIKYELPEEASVRIEVYNILGQHVSTLVDENRQAGQHEVTFDGSELSSGTYIYRIEAGDYTESRQMMLVK